MRYLSEMATRRLVRFARRATDEGYTSAKIGGQLSISPRTVEVHRANMMRKLGLHSRTDLIRYALQREILPMQD